MQQVTSTSFVNTFDPDSVSALPFTKRTLSNGLDVIVHESRGLPIVAINVWYHAGSRNDTGCTGVAHLAEHLMFQGSQHQNVSYFGPLQRAGAALDASTNSDRTNFWQVVPSNAVDLALWMESDRMGFLLPVLTPDRFETQRSVVLNERRQNYEGRPYGTALMAMTAELFRPDHPYQWSTIGKVRDIEAMRLVDIQRFCEMYYHPANASLAVAGDVSTDHAFTLAEKYFGDIPAGPTVPAGLAPPLVTGQRRILVEDNVERPKLFMAWHSPGMFAGGEAEMELAADLLTNGRTSRLSRKLVGELRVAAEVSAYQHSRELAGIFVIAATPSPGHTLEEVAALIDDELMRVVADGFTAEELRRLTPRIEARFVYRLQSLGGFGGRSDQLNAYNTYLRDPGFLPQDLRRYLAVSVTGVRETVERVCRLDRRVILSVVPDRSAALPESELVTIP